MVEVGISRLRQRARKLAMLAHGVRRGQRWLREGERGQIGERRRFRDADVFRKVTFPRF